MTSFLYCRLEVSTSDGTINLNATKTFQRSTKPGITAIKLWRYDPLQPSGFDANSRQHREREMAGRMPSIIDLAAELAKLTVCRRTAQSTMADRKGSVARLASYRDGLLLAIKFSGKDHWESHPGDELIHIIDGTAVLEIVCDDGPPKSFVLRAGMMAVIPQGALHRFLSPEGATQIAVTPSPGDGEHIELDVDDPRTVERKPA
jgi:mannose-6-phosphate isomerase-like protein (cupin superfamily)